MIEDTDFTAEELRRTGFCENVVSAIELMTCEPDVEYMEYVRKIKDNPIARTVKLADLRHNSDITRLDTVTQRDEERVKKYLEAFRILTVQ